jgi:hypothetical protein
MKSISAIVGLLLVVSVHTAIAQTNPIVTIGTPNAGGGVLQGLNVYTTPLTNNKNGLTLAQGTSDGKGGSITFWLQNGTTASPSAVLIHQEMGFMQALGWTGSAWGPAGAPTAYVIIATENWGPSAMGSGNLFQATPNGADVAVAEGCIQNGLVLFDSPVGRTCNTPAGLGLGTVNAMNGVYDNSKRVWSEGNGLTSVSNSLSADVALNNTANFFTGPSTAQGTSGKWFASGSVTLTDPVSATFVCKLWDGTTVISSGASTMAAVGQVTQISLSGVINNPVANIRISCRDLSSSNGTILANAGGVAGSATLTSMRIN